ncbi:LysM peptidoglycan-binding domain-containing protein [Paenibacillus sp. PK1-4R]|uniref:LysM peptidoglycan-binding domain-containing protein n=1 Tax=Paenibacillus sp. PK1-4R TaxID=3049075 RepID=UPI0025A1BC75|nr:LysM peptidoglycan-binding domain-containing protein [Paenibacillus sp. PK1-4R]WJM07231.1 LysM peptidoglycan-binding domain-containing protein [Paenibacillus sp. PK1-4R]
MKIHMVKKGDTLYLLSQKYNVALDKLIAANPQITNPDKLDIGMKIKIPAEPVTPKPEGVLHSHKVQQGDSLWKLAQAWGVPLKDMINANPQLKNPNALLVGETVYIPSMHAQGNSTSNSGAGNIAAQEKLSPEGKEYTGVKEPEPPAPVMPTPPAPVAEVPVPVPVPAPPPANTEKPNVKPELEVLPQLPELPEVKPEKETHKKEEVKPEVHVKPVAESKKYTMPNLSPEIMPLPVMPNTKSPTEVAPATKKPCGCGNKLHHAPAEHPYVQIPVPVQEVYGAQQDMYTAGASNNASFPGIPEVSPYSGSDLPNSPWTGAEQGYNHNNVMPNLSAEIQNNSFPIAPAGEVNSPFPTYAAPSHMNHQPPFISPYSMLPYPPCGCGSHTHMPQYTYPSHGYQDPAWNMYGPSYGMPPEMSTSTMPNQPIEYAYQNPYPTQNMVPPSPLGAFGEMYPPQEQGKGGKKGGREDANLSQVAIEEVGSDSEGKSKQAGNKPGAAKRRTSKAPLKNKSKVSVSGKTSREGAATSNQRKSDKKRRNPWIQN